MDAYDIEIRPIDPMNPGIGYRLTVKRNGATLLSTDKHPQDGEEMSAADALEVAEMYVTHGKPA